MFSPFIAGILLALCTFDYATALPATQLENEQTRRDYYVASAVQAAPLPIRSGESMRDYMNRSLDRVEQLVVQAISESAERPQIIVFPEVG